MAGSVGGIHGVEAAMGTHTPRSGREESSELSAWGIFSTKSLAGGLSLLLSTARSWSVWSLGPLS